jgi:N4-gp56 family major capsid protein
MAITTTSQVDPAVSTMYDRLLLMRARPHLIHSLFAQRRNINKKNGNTIKFRRYTSLSAATTPIGKFADVKPFLIDLEAYGYAA